MGGPTRQSVLVVGHSSFVTVSGHANLRVAHLAHLAQTASTWHTHARAFTHGSGAQNFFGNLLIVRSDPRHDLDPGLVHRLEPLSLLLGILVWDGADGVVPPAVLSILLGCRSPP
jgi:hypothetical protein